ncbi:MAG: M48 family metalloprotease [Nitrospiraceae bacterium]|jgi:predicted Zn-dependent protease|nr:M48 family metalloprotease [Nitrospiraceae bacterium]
MTLRSLLIVGTASLIALTGCRSFDVSSAVSLATTSAVNIAQASQTLSPEQEYYLGRAVGARILAKYPLLDNWKLTEYVNNIGQTLVLFSEQPVTHGGYHFAVLDTMEKNAFACPGGMILITKGLIMTAQNEDELAAVIAHEIGHIVHRDGVSSIQQSRMTEALTRTGTQAAATYGGSTVATLVSVFEGSIDDVFKTIVVNGYSRSQELAADEAALSYLAKAGYEPSAVKTLLEAMRQGTGGGMLSTHPGTDDRIVEVIKKMPATPPNPVAFEARKARFRAALQ